MKKTKFQILKENLLKVFPKAKQGEKNYYNVLLVHGKFPGKAALNYNENGKLKNDHNIVTYSSPLELLNLIEHHRSIGISIFNVVEIIDSKGNKIKDSDKISEELNAVSGQDIVNPSTYKSNVTSGEKVYTVEEIEGMSDDDLIELTIKEEVPTDKKDNRETIIEKLIKKFNL